MKIVTTTAHRCVAARCVLALRHADQPIERVASACRLSELLIRAGCSQHYALTAADKWVLQ